MPVLVTQEVASHHPHFSGTGSLGEADDSLHVTRLEQALETLDLLVGKGVDLRSELEVTLLLDNLGDSKKDLSSLTLLHGVLSGGRNEFLSPFFLQVDIVTLSNGQSLIKVTKTDHDLDSLIVLSVVLEELNGLLEHFRVVTVADSS